MGKNKKNKKFDDVNESSISVALGIGMAAILITTSAITLPLMQSGGDRYLNDVMWGVGIGSVISSALLIDGLLDEAKIDFCKRIKFIGGAYKYFAALIAFICFAVTYLFHTSQNLMTDITDAPIVFAGFGAFWVCWKLMTKDLLDFLSVLNIAFFFLAAWGTSVFYPSMDWRYVCCFILFTVLLTIILRLLSQHYGWKKIWKRKLKCIQQKCKT